MNLTVSVHLCSFGKQSTSFWFVYKQSKKDTHFFFFYSKRALKYCVRLKVLVIIVTWFEFEIDITYVTLRNFCFVNNVMFSSLFLQ